MTANLEQQLIDNENRVALMAAIIANGVVAQKNISLWRNDDYQGCAGAAVRLALAITKEVGKEAEKVRGEL